MGRRKSEIPCKILSFGCWSPSDEDLVFQQKKLAHNYYNWLVAVELRRRTEFRQIQRREIPAMGPLFDEEQQLEGQLLATRMEIRALRKDERKKKVDDALLKVTAKNIKERLKKIREELSAYRSEFTQLLAPFKKDVKDIKEQLGKQEGRKGGPHGQREINFEVYREIEEKWGDTVAWEVHQLDEKYQDLVRVFRKGINAAGLGSGTYLLIEEAVKAAGKKKDPQFRRRLESFRLGVQVQKGTKLISLCSGKCPALRLDDVSGTTTMRLSINRKENITFKVNLHREVADGGVIKKAWVLCRRVGTRNRYSLQLTVENPVYGERQVMGTHTAAVNFGWRKLSKNKYRIGYVVCDDGSEHELLLHRPGRTRRSDKDHKHSGFTLWEALTFPDILQRIIDARFNEVKDVLGKQRALPKWVAKRVPHLKSPRQLTYIAFNFAREVVDPQEIERLWSAWKVERRVYDSSGKVRPLNSGDKQKLFPPFEEVSEWLSIQPKKVQVAIYLEWWRRFNRKMYQWQAYQREKAIASRTDLYWCEAKRLAAEYGTLVIDDTDYSKLQKKPDAEDEEATESWQEANLQRKHLAVGSLRNKCRSAFAKDVVIVTAKDNSRTCSKCGTLMEATVEKTIRCTKCKTTHDVDRNNCINMLRAAREPDATVSTA